MAKIDATSESALAGRFGVSGYPTIKILKKGQAVDYEGSRTQEGEWNLCSWRRPAWDSTGKLRGESLDNREEDKLSGLGVAPGAPASGSAPCWNVPVNRDQSKLRPRVGGVSSHFTP